MPYLRFNVEASPAEEEASLMVWREKGLVMLRMERAPSSIMVTMTREQAYHTGQRLMEAGNAEAQALVDRCS
jgi:hypothetical protein